MGVSVLVSMLYFIPVLVFIGLSIAAVRRAIVLPRSVPGHASCGNCGYNVENLGSRRCPECGQDLLTVGIVTRRLLLARRGSLVFALAGWTFLCLIMLGLALSGAALAAQRLAVGGSVLEINSVTLVPAVGGLRAITIQTRASDDPRTAPPNAIDATAVTPDGRLTYLRISRDGLWFVGSDSGAVQVESGGPAVQTWLAGTGLDPMADEHRELTTALTDLIVSLDDGEPFDSAVAGIPLSFQSVTTGQSITAPGRTSAAATFLPAAATGLSALVWLVGLAYIIRRRRRLLRLPESAEPRPANPEVAPFP